MIVGSNLFTPQNTIIGRFSFTFWTCSNMLQVRVKVLLPLSINFISRVVSFSTVKTMKNHTP